MIYVVTGGAGFIGSHIAERLLKEGNRVRIIDNFLTGKKENLQFLLDTYGNNVEFYECSITDRQSLPSIFDGAEVVFHQAALPSVPLSVERPLDTHDHCVTGTVNVLTAAKDAGVRRVVYAASSSAYGEIEGEFKVETMPPAPISPYGAAKLAGEYYCQAFAASYPLETVCLRYFNVFGPRQDPTSQYSAVIPLFITIMLNGKTPVIYGDGEQSRDFTYIDNVVHGNLLAAHAPNVSGQVINLATGGRISLLDLVSSLNRILGMNVQPIHAPERTGDIKHSRADVEKARELLDFAPIVDFETGLARTVEYYKKNGQ